MIKFINLVNEDPFLIFKKKHDEALEKDQKNIDAIAISSFNANKNQVDSRYVNLKFIDGDNFIFFTNYNSPKSIAFSSHNQVSALIYWHSTNTQIRIKALIRKTSNEYNNKYFRQRSSDKNALAISSNQSRKITSFDQVVKNYYETRANNDLSKCPEYWGGFSFSPYEIEFWVGDRNRLNKRNLYVKNKNNWDHSILEP